MSEHTHTLENGAAKRLERSRSDRMVAGVCGGLARYFDIHPAFYRVGFVVLTLLGGAGILIYAATALVMPDEGKEDSIASAALRNRRHRPWPLIGLTHVGARVDVGGLRVIVPQDVALRVHGDAQLGKVEVLGQTANGRNVDKRIDQAGKRVLVLDAHVGVGNVRVIRAVR